MKLPLPQNLRRGILIEGKVHLHGGYNFDNLLMAVAIATESGIDPIDIAAILPQLIRCALEIALR